VHWFRLHAHFDLAAHRERVIFTYRRVPAVTPLLHVQRESLLDRFPLRQRPAAARWRDAVERIAARGAGCALFVAHDDPAAGDDHRGTEVVAADDDLAWLLARHVGGRRAELMFDDGDALRAALARHGLQVGC
jgi:hypothetical protein